MTNYKINKNLIQTLLKLFIQSFYFQNQLKKSLSYKKAFFLLMVMRILIMSSQLITSLGSISCFIITHNSIRRMSMLNYFT